MQHLDWTLLRSFFAVVETGSLSAAAAYLTTTQPTLSRHIRELETQLGISLFTRSASGVKPTDAALGLVDDARVMGEAAQALALKARGRFEKVAGTVRVTTTASVAGLVLPSILSDLREAEPDIRIELTASDQPSNLAQREADIAIRMRPPSHNALIARKLGESSLGLYGAKSYFARRGRVQAKADLIHHDVIGCDQNDVVLKAFERNGLTMRQENFPVRTDDMAANWNLMLAGIGLGFAQAFYADRHPELERVDAGLEFVASPIWLVMHEEVRSNRRIRRVADFLGDKVGTLLQETH